MKAKPENGEKTTIGLISKKATLHVQHTFFLYISLPSFCTTTTLCLSLALYSKFVDMTINLSLKKQFPLFGFIDSLAASALQEAGGYAISRKNNLELSLGFHTC